MLTIANRLYEGELGLEEDWWALIGWEGPMPEAEDQGPSIDDVLRMQYGWTDEQLLKHKIEDEKIRLTNSVREWLSLASSHLDFSWYEEVAQFKLTTGGLFGALAMQVALAITKSSGLALCSYRGKVEMVKSQPRTDRNFYCQDCRNNKTSRKQAYKRYDRKRPKKNSRLIAPR